MGQSCGWIWWLKLTKHPSDLSPILFTKLGSDSTSVTRGVSQADASEEPPPKDSPSLLCCLRHDPVSEQAQLIDPIVTGLVQEGMVQPTGRPIKVSTQRGLSFFLWFAGSSRIGLPCPPHSLTAPIECSPGTFGVGQPTACGSRRLPAILRLSWA